MDRATEMIDNARDIINTLSNLRFWRNEIEEALARTCGTHTFDDVVELVAQGKLIPMFLPNAFMLYSINIYPQCKQLHIFIAGGDMKVIIAAKPDLEEAARKHDCDRVTINGRPGWARALRETGARLITTTMALEVPHGRRRQDSTEIREQTEPGSQGSEQVHDRHDDDGRSARPMVNGVSGTTDGRA